MSKSNIKNKEPNENEESEEYSEGNEYIYQNKYINEGPPVKDSTYCPPVQEVEGIRINLEKIDERAPEEEESCISSLVLSRDGKRPFFLKNEKNIKALIRILKYQNVLYNYFNLWKRKLKMISVKKRLRKLKKKKKLSVNKSKEEEFFLPTKETKNSKSKNSNEKNDKKKFEITKYDEERIRNFIRCLDEFAKNYMKRWIKEYFDKLKNFELSKKKDEIEEKHKYKNENNNIKDDFNDNNLNKGMQRKELKVKRSEFTNPKQNKEVKKSFRIGQLNDNLVMKFEEAKKNLNKITNKNVNNENNESNSNYDEEQKSEDKEINNNPQKDEKNIKVTKKKGIKSKKVKKKKKTKKTKLNELKKMIEKIDNKKYIKTYLDKWIINTQMNEKIDGKVTNLNYNLYDMKNNAYIQKPNNLQDINNESNNYYQINSSTNKNDMIIPIFLNNYSPQEEYNINNNFFIGSIKNEEELQNFLGKKESVEVKQRKYTNEESPKVNEHTVKIIKLSKPIKEIKNGGLEIRVAEEYIEYGTEITRYPSEITETITTKRISSDDNDNDNMNESQEEIDKMIKVNQFKYENGPPEKQLEKYEYEENKANNFNNKISFDVDNNKLKEYINENYKNKNNKNDKNDYKKAKSTFVLENEVPKEIKKRYTDYNNIPKEDIEPKKEKNSKININEIETKKFYKNNSLKLLSAENKNYTQNVQNQQNEEEEDEKYNSFQDYNVDMNDVFPSNTPMKPFNDEKQKQKEKGKTTSEKSTNKKTKKLIRKYKKAMHLLRRAIRSRRKRIRKQFHPEEKKKFYFELWVKKSFPNGLQKNQDQKKSKVIKDIKEKKLDVKKEETNNNYINNNSEKENKNNKNFKNLNLYKKTKIMAIIDIIRMNRKRNKKLKLKLKELNELDKKHFCFKKWYNFTFKDDDKNEEEEFDDIQTFSSAKENSSYFEQNKKANVVKEDITNNAKKKNSLKFNRILKKLLILYENIYKKKYFIKWKENSLLENSDDINIISKSKSTNLNLIKNPFPNSKKGGKRKEYKNKNKNKKDSIKIDNNDKREIENQKEIKNKDEDEVRKSIKNEKKKEIIINTDIKPSDINIKKENLSKEEGKKELNKEEESEESKEGERSGLGQDYVNINNNFTKISDIENNRKDNNINNNKNNKNKKYKKDKKIILSKILEKINNKKKLKNYFKKWYNNKLLRRRHEFKSEDNITPRNIMSNIADHFFPSNESNNEIYNINLVKTYNCKYHRGSSFANSYNNKRKQKRIFVQNELSLNRKRSNTLMNFPKLGNINDNYTVENEDENISERMNFKSPIKHFSNVNINSSKSKKSINKTKSRENSYDSKTKKKKKKNSTLLRNNEILKEKQKKLIKNINDINLDNINLMNKNINIMQMNKNTSFLNIEFLEAYLNLLKQNNNALASYQIFYLYSLFNEENDYLNIKHAFNKWKKQK